jgi:hypothetical protein
MTRLMQLRYQIQGDERRIAWNAGDPLDAGAMCGSPFESCQDARQRSQGTCNRIRHDRKRHILEARKCAVRIDDHAFALRGKAPRHMLEKRKPLEDEEGLVAPSHTAGKASRQNHTEGGGRHRAGPVHSITMRGAGLAGAPPASEVQTCCAMSL